MPITHDGLQTPLPPSPQGLGIGLVVLAGGVAAAVFGQLCIAVPVLLIGTLMVVNQVNGTSRTRVTFSKLLIEDERLVMGFLVGPSKRRIQWQDLASVDVVDGEVVIKGHTGSELRTGKGCTPEELEQLKGKIEEAARLYAEEAGE